MTVVDFAFTVFDWYSIKMLLSLAHQEFLKGELWGTGSMLPYKYLIILKFL